LTALHNYWWGILINKTDLTPKVTLPHPEKLDVSPAMFMDFYLPENLKKDNYITLVNPQNPAVKYGGKPEGRVSLLISRQRSMSVNDRLRLLNENGRMLLATSASLRYSQGGARLPIMQLRLTYLSRALTRVHLLG
jgi:hypothetical protein